MPDQVPSQYKRPYHFPRVLGTDARNDFAGMLACLDEVGLLRPPPPLHPLTRTLRTLTLALIPTLARTLHTRTRQPLTLTLTLTRTLHPLVTRTPIHPPYPQCQT